jgi:carboxypeptidase Taq
VTNATAQTAQAFRDYVKQIVHYYEALALMEWDLRTGAPKKGAPLRAEAIGTLSSESFRMRTSEQMAEYLHILTEPNTYESLDSITRASVREMKKEFDLSSKIPADRNHAYVVLASQAQSVWEEAKHTSDFALFRPYLEKIVDMKNEFIEYWGYQDNKYDTLLDQYEPGVTVSQLDSIFGNLRQETVQLVQAIGASKKNVNVEPLTRPFEKNKQRDFSRILLEKLGYDFAAGRLDETVHPFQTTLNLYDARVTTMYALNDVRSSIFSTIHEAGHALYEQGVSPDLIGTVVCGGASMGIHESQSRFFENMIGRSSEFWQANYGELQRVFPGQLADFSLDDFYRAVNDVRPSLIRIEADEVTYNLHIMIRYEIEKGLINQDIKVADLPGIWREKMQDYLGVTPPDDAHGVLQDVHWSGGDFGYFPSYSLGNIYAAQFRNTLAKEIPNYMEDVRDGNLQVIKSWFNEKIHKHGRMLTPGELVKGVTGEDIDSKYLVQYFHEKFSPLYDLA